MFLKKNWFEDLKKLTVFVVKCIFIDKNRNYKSGNTIKNQLSGKNARLGQCVVQSQLNDEAKYQLLTRATGNL